MSCQNIKSDHHYNTMKMNDRKLLTSTRNLALAFALLAVVFILVGVAFGLQFPVTRDSRKPRVVPPGIVFSVVWPILYASMALAAYLLLTTKTGGAQALRAKYIALICLTLQLYLNYAWIPSYGAGKNAWTGMYILLIILGLVLCTIVCALGSGTWSAAAVLTPYATWLLFAAMLNYGQITTQPIQYNQYNTTDK